MTQVRDEGTAAQSIGDDRTSLHRWVLRWCDMAQWDQPRPAATASGLGRLREQVHEELSNSTDTLGIAWWEDATVSAVTQVVVESMPPGSQGALRRACVTTQDAVEAATGLALWAARRFDSPQWRARLVATHEELVAEADSDLEWVHDPLTAEPRPAASHVPT